MYYWYGKINMLSNIKYLTIFNLDSGCPPNGNVRLIGSDYYMGRAEVCQAGVWTCFCGETFTRQHGELICSQLGLSGLYRYSTGPARCSAGGWTNIQCGSDATNLQDCTYSLSTSSCIQVRIECSSEFTHDHQMCSYITLKFSSATSEWNTTTTRQLSSAFG